MEKNDAQISGFLVAKKAQSPCKKCFSKKKKKKKKISPAYLRRYDLQNVMRKKLTKKQETFTHPFGDNYLKDHLVKFLQD